MKSSATLRLLASDLDGTLIPPDESPDRLRELEELRRAVDLMDLSLAYVTGRRLSSALRGIERFGLPWPEALACDVGATVYWRRDGTYEPDAEHEGAVQASPDFVTAERIRAVLADLAPIRLQEPENQHPFKVSYYVDEPPSAALVEEVRARLAEEGRVRIVVSHDPAGGDGLLDLLAEGAGKANAVQRIAGRMGLTDEDVVFAGDSGNDRDALLSGVRAILVGNAPDSFRGEVRSSAERQGLAHRIFFASSHFAAGVVEGLGHFDTRAAT